MLTVPCRSANGAPGGWMDQLEMHHTSPPEGVGHLLAQPHHLRTSRCQAAHAPQGLHGDPQPLPTLCEQVEIHLGVGIIAGGS